jgi:hypothetical protein
MKMEEFFSEEEKQKRLEKDLILRKSLLRGQTSKIAQDNIKLRENFRKMVKIFLKGGGLDNKNS